MARHKESDTASRGCVTRRGRGGSLQRLSTARSQRHSSRAAWAATVIDARHASRVRTRAAAAGLPCAPTTMQAHHRRSLWPGAPPTTMLPGFVPDETTTIGEAPLTKPRVWFDARANKARITYPPGGGPGATPPPQRQNQELDSLVFYAEPAAPDVPARFPEMTPIKKLLRRDDNVDGVSDWPPKPRRRGTARPTGDGLIPDGHGGLIARKGEEEGKTIVYYGATNGRASAQLDATMTPLQPEQQTSRRHFEAHASPILPERPGRTPAPKWLDHFGADGVPTVGPRPARVHRKPPTSSFQRGQLIMPSEGTSVSPSSKGGMNPQARASHFEEDFVPGEVDEFLVRADKMRGHQFPQRMRTSFKDEALVVPQDYPYREPVEPHPTVRDSLYGAKEGLVSTVEPAGRGRRQVPRSQRVALEGAFDGAWG